MIFYYIFCLVLTTVYVFLLSSYIADWKKILDWQTPEDFIPNKFISIIIAARNESESIAACLQAIQTNSIPIDHYEIILVNDNSEDDTAEVASKLNIENLILVNQAPKEPGKKLAIQKGISMAKGEIIITTDADCLPGKDWMKSMLSFQEHHQAKLITGPIVYQNEKTLLEKFQSLDIVGLMGVTAVGIYSRNQYMANGANLLYTKEAFNSIDGFKGNENLASGDDMFLIHKCAELFPDDVYFVKSREAIVSTIGESSLQDLLEQRKRWATKTTSYTDKRLVLLLAAVFIFCLSIILNLFLSCFSIFALVIAGAQILAKLVMDYLFLSKMTSYFNKGHLLQSFLPSSVLHLMSIVYSGVVGLTSRHYVWKGRKEK